MTEHGLSMISGFCFFRASRVLADILIHIGESKRCLNFLLDGKTNAFGLKIKSV